MDVLIRVSVPDEVLVERCDAFYDALAEDGHVGERAYPGSFFFERVEEAARDELLGAVRGGAFAAGEIQIEVSLA